MVDLHPSTSANLTLSMHHLWFCPEKLGLYL